MSSPESSGTESSGTESSGTDGRVPGRRGLETRRRFLDQTRDLVETTNYRDLKVVDIAREVGSSPGTFYQYFADVESAVLALADELAEEGSRVLIEPLRSADWRGQHALDACEEIAQVFLSFWSQHSGLMAVIDLAALEGDARFRACRTRLLNRFTVTATDVIRAQKEAGFAPVDLDPEASAVVLVSMLSHVAAHQRGISESGVTIDDLRRSMARVIYASVIGRTPLN